MAGFVRATEKTEAERARECVAGLLARARSARTVGEALDASCTDLDGKLDPEAARGLSVEIPLDAGTVASHSAANTPLPDSERLRCAADCVDYVCSPSVRAARRICRVG